jgi:hypothetical protein
MESAESPKNSIWHLTPQREAPKKEAKGKATCLKSKERGAKHEHIWKN